MYTVLDPKLNVVGFLSNKGRGANDFWGDTISQQIADTQDILGNVDLTVDNVSRNIDVSGNTKNWNHTLNGISFNNTLVGAQVENGYYLLYQDDANKRHYLMQLTSVSENVTPGGQHYKTATGVNAALYDFSRMIVDAKEFYASPTGTQTLGSLQNILRYILGHAGWNVNVEDYNFPDITYSISDGASVQSVLQDIIKLFEVDVDAYVTKTPQGQLAQRVVSFRQQMGTDSGVTIRYGKNMTDMTREELSDSIYTKLYVQGANSLKLNTMNNGLPHIVDEAANKLYNPVGASSSPETFREGVVVNSMITDERSLLAWGKKQLQALNHPRINYTISSIASTEAGLGDTIRVQDLYASQQILLTSRVIQKTISFANPTTNTLVLGEYSSVIGDKTKNVDLIAKLGQVADDITVVSEAAVKTQVIAEGAASSAATHANTVEYALSSAFNTAKSDVARLYSENKADTASLNSLVTEQLASASAQRTSLADTTSSMVADAETISKSLADSAYAGAMAGVTSAGNLIAGVSAAVRDMGSTVTANKSAITKVGSDLATGVASAAAYADSLTAKVGNSASAAVSSVASDVNGVKAEFDSVKKTASELSVATNSLSVGASGIDTKLTEVTSTASGAMSAAASLAADASGLHASYDKLSSQHAKDVETMNASYSAGINGLAADIKTVDTNAKGYATAAQNSAIATASQNATTLVNTATTTLSNGIANTYATQTQLTQTASQFNVTATNLQNQVNSMGQVNQLFNTEFSPDFLGWTTEYRWQNGIVSSDYSFFSKEIWRLKSSNIMDYILGNGATIISEPMPYSASGGSVSISGYVSAGGGNDGAVALRIVFYDSNKKMIATSAGATDTTNATMTAVSDYMAPPTTTAYVAIKLAYSGTKGTARLSRPMMVFNSTSTGNYVPGNYNNNSRVAALEVSANSIAATAQDTAKSLSATATIAANGVTIATQASNAANSVAITASGAVTQIASVSNSVNTVTNTLTQTANQVTQEIADRKNGDTAVTTQLTNLINTTVSNTKSGLQTSINQTAEAFSVQLSSANLLNNSQFEVVNGTLPGWHADTPWGATAKVGDGTSNNVSVNGPNSDGTTSLIHDQGGNAKSWLFSDPIPTMPNSTYSGSFELAESSGWATSSQVSFARYIRYYTSDHVLISSDATNYFGGSIGGDWTRYSFMVNTPATQRTFHLVWAGRVVRFHSAICLCTVGQKIMDTCLVRNQVIKQFYNSSKTIG